MKIKPVEDEVKVKRVLSNLAFDAVSGQVSPSLLLVNRLCKQNLKNLT